MEVSVVFTAGAIVLVALVSWTLNWVWLRPKRLEKYLRKQGFKGNPYRLLNGDIKEVSSMRREADAKPISLSDDIVPRIIPFDNHNIEKYGRDSFMWVGLWPRVNIMDPEQIKDVYVKYGDIHRPNPWRALGNGLPMLEDEKWAKHKKIINPAFHIEKLKLMLPAMYLSCNEMISKWEDLVSAEGSGSCELDVWPFFHDMAGDVISRTAFGSNFEEGRTIFQLQRELAMILMKSMESPFLSVSRLFANKRMEEINNKLRSVLKGIIANKETAMKAGEATSNDLLGILLESNMNEIRDHSNNKNAGMSIADVIEECKIFYFAGQDTSSILLVWTMVLLSHHRKWQDRARAEVLQVFGDRKPDYEGLSRLKTVTMILYEVLRLYPPIPLVTRFVHKETKLGKLTLPVGVNIGIPLPLVQRDTNIWGDDAKEFNPERFSDGISKATKNGGSFLSFGWGPRVCIGQNFGMMESKLALAMILQRFWFELAPSYVHAPTYVVTLIPQYGCPVVLHKR